MWIYAQVQGEIFPKGMLFLYMIIVKNIWKAYTSLQHNSTTHIDCKGIWESSVHRVKLRVAALLHETEYQITRFKQGANQARRPGSQTVRIEGVRKRANLKIAALGSIIWNDQINRHELRLTIAWSTIIAAFT